MQVTWQPVKLCDLWELGKWYRLTPTWQTPTYKPCYVICELYVLSKTVLHGIQAMGDSLMPVILREVARLQKLRDEGSCIIYS